MCFWKSAAFRTEQKAWYSTLLDSGFIDIEDTRNDERLLKSWHSTKWLKGSASKTPQDFESTVNYYNSAEQYARAGKFKTQDDKDVWALHSTGLSIRKIARTLTKPIAYILLVIKTHRKIMLREATKCRQN